MRTVEEILQVKGGKLLTINENQTLYDALLKLTEANIGALVVTDSDGLFIADREFFCRTFGLCTNLIENFR